MNDFVIENGILVKYTGTGGNVVIPEGVTEISWNAYLDLRKAEAVTSLVLPKSMADISKCEFRMLQNMESLTFGAMISKIDYTAFSDEELSFWWSFSNTSIDGEVSWCRQLKNFHVDTDNKTYAAVDGVVFTKNQKKLVLFPSARESYVVPEGTTHIMTGAFYGALGLKSVVFPESVTSIAGKALCCTSVEFVRLPKSITKLAKKAVDVPYVAFYHPEIADSVKYSIYLGGSIEDLPAKTRNAAVTGFLYAMKNGMTEIKAFEESYVAFVRRNIKTYCKKAAEDEFLLHWMLENALIPEKELQKLIEECSKTNRSDLMAELLNYQNNHFTAKEDSDPLADDAPEMKQALKKQARLEQLQDQDGIRGISFVASGELKNFGTMDEYTGEHDLRDLKAFIEARGGFLRSAVSTKTDYLICNDISIQTAKVKRAQELGTAIISEAEFLKMAK